MVVRIPDFDPIDYLAGRRFPDFAQVMNPPLLEQQLRKGNYHYLESLKPRKEEIQSYKDELSQLPEEKLWELVSLEKEKQSEQLRKERELEESQRFFNRPDAEADFEFWSRAVYWTVDEAVALSFGKSPEKVNWESVKPYTKVSDFALKYSQLRELAIRAVHWNQLSAELIPGFYLAWAQRNGVDVPAALLRAVEGREILASIRQ